MKSPQGTSILSEVSSFNLPNKNISIIPAEIERFSNIRALNLRDNPIETLPSTFGNLKKLVWLNCAFTSLSYVPTCLFTLPLQYLSLYMYKQPQIDKEALEDQEKLAFYRQACDVLPSEIPFNLR